MEKDKVYTLSEIRDKIEEIVKEITQLKKTIRSEKIEEKQLVS